MILLKDQTKQGGREISDITVTDDYLHYKKPKSPYVFRYFDI